MFGTTFRSSERGKGNQMANIFRQALKILGKNGERTEEEKELVTAATIPLDMLPQFNDMTTPEGLEELAKIVEEAE